MNEVRQGGRLERLLRVAPWLGAGSILLLPLVAMQFTEEIVWTASDFLVGGTLLFGAAFLFEVAMRAKAGLIYRAAAAVGLGASLFLVWAILAVGITDTPADLMYGVVLVIGVTGALAARIRPVGMARTLAGMAAAVALITVLTLTGGLTPAYNTWVEILLINAMFAGMYAISAVLFNQAARREEGQ